MTVVGGLLRAVFVLHLLAAGAAQAKTSRESASSKALATATQGTTVKTGLFDLYVDGAKGRILLGIKAMDEPFLLATSLPYGLGSNDVGLDRGQPGRVRMVEFRRVARRVLLVELNTRFQARSDHAPERDSVRQAFAESVLWAGDLLVEPDAGQALNLIDFSSFMISDRHGIAAALELAKQGKYSVDNDRSLPLLDIARTFPDNTELEALLTFTGPGEGEFVRDVAMDPLTLSLRQHLSLVRLPPPGYSPRAYHPASGAYSAGYVDLAKPFDVNPDVRLQPRFRLEKTEPGAALSAVTKPIVFYLDPGTPEPVRSALIEGANWWAAGFEQAGFKDAFRVELLPEGADPMDIRYNIIEWVHRSTRGWSYGGSLVDPRTGEIIKGSVTLGSDRVRQDMLIAESLLAPYGKPDQAQRLDSARAAVLARTRQLAAHEVGHALGFAHNFAASRQGNGSVMDYPHPLLKLDADGEVDLNQAYGTGVGPWDLFLVKHAYAQFAPDREARSLADLRAEAARSGMRYISDGDARAPGSGEADGLLWDFGTDTLQTFDRLLAIRHRALATFSEAVLGPDRQIGELEVRLVPIYLLHRYQTEAVARLVGGATYEYALGGEGKAGTRPVAADQQREALQRLVRNLSAEELALPASVLDALTPPGNEYARTREYFATASAPLFDPINAVESATALTARFLFDPARLNRVAWQHARDAQVPGVAAVLDAVFAGTWQRDASALTVPGATLVQAAANSTMLDVLINTLDSGQLHAPVEADVRAALLRWRGWLRAQPGAAAVAANRADATRFLDHYLTDPSSLKRRPLPVIPPGPPI